MRATISSLRSGIADRFHGRLRGSRRAGGTDHQQSLTRFDEIARIHQTAGDDAGDRSADFRVRECQLGLPHLLLDLAQVRRGQPHRRSLGGQLLELLVKTLALAGPGQGVFIAGGPGNIEVE